MQDLKIEFSFDYVYDIWKKQGKPKNCIVQCPFGYLTEKVKTHLLKYNLSIKEKDATKRGTVYEVRSIS